MVLVMPILKYTGVDTIVIPDYGKVRTGDKTPDLPKDVYDGLKARDDFEPVKKKGGK